MSNHGKVPKAPPANAVFGLPSLWMPFYGMAGPGEGPVDGEYERWVPPQTDQACHFTIWSEGWATRRRTIIRGDTIRPPAIVTHRIAGRRSDSGRWYPGSPQPEIPLLAREPATR